MAGTQGHPLGPWVFVGLSRNNWLLSLNSPNWLGRSRTLENLLQDAKVPERHQALRVGRPEHTRTREYHVRWGGGT